MQNNTNLIERFQGTIKDRTKVMRALKNRETLKRFMNQKKAPQEKPEEFKEFNQWCEANLGTKYKDWFLAGAGGVRNTKYTLYLKDTKKSMFLALKFSESIDETSF